MDWGDLVLAVILIILALCYWYERWNESQRRRRIWEREAVRREAIRRWREVHEKAA